MTTEMETSKICDFYRDKQILLTGASGFLGKLVIEKLLRVCQPSTIYLLIRTKKGVEAHNRIKEITSNSIFDEMKKKCPDYLSRLHIVAGDLAQPELGIGQQDRDILIDRVQVVFHVAATVRFNEKLPIATKINVLGTKSILQLCHKMKNLMSVVHVSTAFAYCPHKEIKEEFYEPPISSENLIKFTECLKESMLEMFTPGLLSGWPNTYSFTKAVAESAVLTYGKNLPISLFRPAIVVPTRSEPVAGWIEGLNGPTGIGLALALGVMHAVTMDTEALTHIVPADMTVNCLLAIGYKSYGTHSQADIPVYNYTCHPSNTITWGKYVGGAMDLVKQIPSGKAIWYPSWIAVTNKFLFLFLSFFFHTLPALIVDTGLVLMNRKPVALKICKKIIRLQELLEYFTTRSWHFAVNNTESLWENLGETDKKLFYFDMKSLDFSEFLIVNVHGIRQFCSKESCSTIPYAKKKMFWLLVLHRLLQGLIVTFIGWCIWRMSTYLINV